ncbi:MAG TPA: Trm112 family protein [Planctomycetota bacterium]|nr:Trm112 family protein [Planctomycetota bacterium]
MWEVPRVIDKELLDILACPVCKTAIKLEDDRLVCTKCGRRYPIRNGNIPVMLADEAELPGQGKP